jgi:hypothetical protein
MPVIYLQHPKHGAKVAISDQEAQHDIKNGWAVFDPSATIKPADDAPSAPQATDTLIINQLPAQRGRRRKNADTQEE